MILLFFPWIPLTLSRLRVKVSLFSLYCRGHLMINQDGYH